MTWHDSCHIGRVSGVYEEPRDLIKALPNVKLVEMAYNRNEAHCCGSVVTLIKDPPIAAEIGETRIGEAQEAGAQKYWHCVRAASSSSRHGRQEESQYGRCRPGPLLLLPAWATISPIPIPR